MMTDPIADTLARIRNAILARHQTVDIPSSKVKVALARILEQEGFVDGVKVVPATPRDTLRIQLRYAPGGESVITGLERVSRPGRRVYCSKDEIPKVLGGLGIAVLSTSKGLLSGRDGKRMGLGGEILCTVW
jgi:small subunit ribosomal protein S8